MEDSPTTPPGLLPGILISNNHSEINILNSELADGDLLALSDAFGKWNYPSPKAVLCILRKLNLLMLSYANMSLQMLP